MKKKLLIVLLIPLLALWQCDENNSTETSSGKGSIRMYLVDSPASLDAIVICVARVEVHKAGNDESPGSWTAINDSVRYFNLLELQNGASAVLGDTSLPVGLYTQIRLVLLDSNYVKGGGIQDSMKLTVPSGLQTGLKLNHSFEIESDNLYELYLDFNADKSVLVIGNGEYELKPTIRLSPVITSGTISGRVSPQDAYPMIWTLVGEDKVSTDTDDNGYFKLMAIPEGTYEVHITPDENTNYDEMVISNVKVNTQEDTYIEEIMLNEKQ
jgi:hypothetical protein